MTAHARNPPTPPRFAEALRFWLKLGFISFGGPTGQIAIMHEQLVDQRRWISDTRFLHALNYCMLLPGPEAQQLATYIGWLLHGARGGIAAGVLFVLPSAFLLFGLSWLYMVGGNLAWVAALFAGLKPAILAIVAAAVLRIGGKALKNGAMIAIAVLAFLSIFLLKAPFPLIIGLAALTGWLGGRLRPDLFRVIRGHGAGPAKPEPESLALEEHTAPSWGRAARVVSVCLALWWAPVVATGLALGWHGTHVQQGLFFSKAALVTFGGAYAVLPYVAQQAVDHYGWVTTPQMMDGLGLAESTPGPLIMVLQFVGFLGAWSHPPVGWSPLASAALGSFLTTWVTFLPCFLYIFLGAPHLERLRGNATLSCALSAVTAAVVGVVLNLGVWFGAHTLHPAPGEWDLVAGVTALALFAAMQRAKLGVIPVVLIGAGLGLVRWLVQTA